MNLSSLSRDEEERLVARCLRGEGAMEQAEEIAAAVWSSLCGEAYTRLRQYDLRAGRLLTYLNNTYSARKLGARSTGNAARGLAGAPGIGCGNLYIEPGSDSPEAIIAGVNSGLYVTSLMGFGVNLVTGDYSRGATGLWIEKGQLTHAVEEITIAGNLTEMLMNLTAIGNDLEFRSAVAAPTLRIDGMTIAGS